MKPILSVKNLSKNYTRGAETVHALCNVTFDIERGSFTAITGSSGSGKTTLLHILGCLDRPSSGSVAVNGSDVGSLPEKDVLAIRRNTIGFVFQQFYLMPGLTVAENIALPLLFNRSAAGPDEILKTVESVGLGKRAGHLPDQLSGGEMQRAAIGRAMVGQPDIILADEPTANLDSANTEIIFELFRDLATRGITVVLVTHNQRLAARTGRIIALEDGRLTAPVN